MHVNDIEAACPAGRSQNVSARYVKKDNGTFEITIAYTTIL